jgi:hypothetical protein
MNSRNLITGVLLLALGLLFLGRNLGWFYVDWHDLSRFWPVLVILLGVNLLFGRRSRALTVASVILLAVALPLAIVSRHHDRFEHRDFFDDDHDEEDEDRGGTYDREDDEDDNDAPTDTARISGSQRFSEPMDAAVQSASFAIKGGAAHFRLDGTSLQLAEANTNLDFGRYGLTKTVTADGKTASLTFEMKGEKKMKWKNGDWKDGGLKNQVDLRLNPAPLWDLSAEIGAGEADFDLTPYRVRTLKLETGVTDVDIKLGDRADLTDVDVDAGVAHIAIKVPQSVGCRIKHDGLSLMDFDGFEKVNGYYQTAGYDQAPKKININFDSGLAKLDVERY